MIGARHSKNTSPRESVFSNDLKGLHEGPKLKGHCGRSGPREGVHERAI